MAFFFLFTGLLVGASLVSLSESERDYYYTNRNVNMSYIGNKDGLDVYRDNFTGQFYVDDGWDVSRVGTAGFVPHPVDRERLKQLCQKYNPQNIPWVDFLLASFEDREQQLWTNFFEKYELGPKPKEPTWGKGIRKARWAEYGKQLDDWEARKNSLTPVFQAECRQWDEKRKTYDAQHQNSVSQMAGKVLLQRAMSGGGPAVIVQMPAAPAATMTYRAVVPPSAKPGDTIMVNAGGQTMQVVVPQGAFPGTEISFQGPAAQAQVLTPVAPSAAPTAAPPAIKPPPASTSAPPPAYKAPPVPPAAAPASSASLDKQSSIKW